MRRILFLIGCLVGLSINGLAQNEIGVLAFPQISSIHNKANRQGDPIYQANLTYAYGAGVFFLHDFKKRAYGAIRNGVTGRSLKTKWSGKVSLLYSAHEQKWTSQYSIKSGLSDTILTHQGRKRLDYLKLPIVGQLTFPLTNKYNLALFAGPQVSYLLNAQGGNVIWRRYASGATYFDLPFADKKYFKRFTLDGVFGATVEYKGLSRWVHLLVGVRGDFSITNSENSEAIVNNYPVYGDINNYEKERGDSHNSTVALMVGLNYIFHVPDYHRTRF